MSLSSFEGLPPSTWVADNDLAFAVRGAFPVSPGHTLVVTKRRTPTWWKASAAERAAVMDLVSVVAAALDEELHPDGYNVGCNAGEAAGQTVPHLHVHVIPASPATSPTPVVTSATPSPAATTCTARCWSTTPPGAPPR